MTFLNNKYVRGVVLYGLLWGGVQFAIYGIIEPNTWKAFAAAAMLSVFASVVGYRDEQS